ncbi:Pyridoxamine 5'-phosphate oxidase-related, FMN-binding [Citrifermentans bremense]|uniref:Pyridoxamine 5'-phosphate oxidase-related, FMN-binding n=1 Tax=Citrifermentans bremense TaxID=60035 RepID=A0A6S6LYW9_9BACT|nr:pyridoxamine 5'-phosphate oxidase family protein [Citrifermentans bremense]BCG47287.1 Pyridoxamine 5'-phosphate oxidase-related, FMN-binding [Citrifermentans bremense]
MIPEKMKEVMKHEGVVAIVTQGEDGPHLVNTWNSYLALDADERLLIPAGYMHVTEKNVTRNPKVLLTLGSREVQGTHGPGTGFLVEGNARFITDGPVVEATKSTFPWARGVLEITITNVTQTL